MPENLEVDDSDAKPAGTPSIDSLVLVSNRQPYRHRYDSGDGDDVVVDTPAGGLALGIDPVMQRIDGTWIAWGDGDADFDTADDDNQVEVPPGDPAYTLQRIRLSEDQVRGYYDGYANQALWPLLHAATGRVNFDADDWRDYRDVNQRFADAVLDHVGDGETVWFQDYHFALAPRLVSEAKPDALLMHFVHVPWPSPDVFRLCPQDTAILDGLLGNDLLGFHLPRYVAQFLQCVEQHVDAAIVDWATSSVIYDGQRTKVAAFPLGIDAEDIRDTARDADGRFWRRFCHTHHIDQGTTVAIGVDRLDYAKGIPERLAALRRLLETRPDLRGEFTYVQKGCTTRERIPAYEQLRAEVEGTIDALDERFGTDDWSPVVYTTEMYDREKLVTMYREADLALVSSLRDGMNLVAKEYVAAQTDEAGTLLLSPLAGAYEQLGEPAIDFDPYDTAGAAEAIERAIDTTERERRERMRALGWIVHETDLSWWLDEVLEAAAEVRQEKRGHHTHA